MRIGIDARVLQEPKLSGIPHYANELIKTILNQDSHDEYVLFYNYFKGISRKLSGSAGRNCRALKMRLPNKLLNYGLFKLLGLPKVDRLAGSDIFFMPHFNFISLEKYRSLILTIHDLSFLRYPEFFTFRKRFWHRMSGVKKLLCKAGKIIAVSRSTKADILELAGVSEDQVSVVYPGFDRSKFGNMSDNALEKTKKKYGLPDRFILCLGTVEPRKNVKGLMRAFDLFKSSNQSTALKLVIAGSAGWKTAGITRALEESRNKKDFIFTGYIDEEDKPALFSLSRMFAYPSFYEGFGFPILEAFSAGTPVLTSPNSSIPEVAGDAALYADPFNAEEIAYAIKALDDDRDLRKILIARGFAQAEKFNWRDCTEKHFEIFRSCLSMQN